MHALVLDALAHPGPVDRTRVPAAVCLEQVFGGIDAAGLVLQLPGLAAAVLATRPEVATEPPVRCTIAGTCATAPAVTRVLVAARLRDGAIRRAATCARPCRARRATALVLRASAAGQVRLRFDRGRARVTGPVRSLRAGRPRTLTVSARVCRTPRTCRTLAVGSHRVRVQTRPARTASWRTERTLRLRVRSR